MRNGLLIFALCCMGLSASDDKKEWDVNASFAKTKPVTFTTDEGTWMNLDVSPDGSEIVFDMLGDLYTMPINGGKATRLIGDASMELQPRYSPDGKWISFTSDRAGGDNIWIINRESGDLKQVSKESFRLLNNAVWTPDSQYLIARKHFTSTRSLGAGEMWMYHISGGSGLQLTKRKNDQQDAGEPEISPDGRYLWFSEDVSPGPFFQYNKNPNTQIYVIRQLDRETGDLRRLITGVGGSARPEVSPNGKHIAFVRRIRGKSALFLYNRETGGQDALFDGLNQDQQEAWAVFGIYPNFAWTHDGKALIFWAKGKIHRLEIASKKVTPIPFEVEVDKTVHHSPRFKQEVSPDNFEAKMIRDAATSPDGKTLVFHAVGKLYQKSLPDGDPKRLTNGEDLWEYDPAFSPDGKQLVYTTWRDGERGAIEVLDLASGKSRTLTKRPGYYLTPRFSPDGKRIVYQRGSGNSVLGQLHSVDTGLFHIDSNGGEPVKLSESGREPRFNAAGDRIYFLTGFGLNKKYKSLNLTGGDERTHFDLKYVTSVVPSPNGKWVAFTELHNAYIAAFPQTGKSISLNKNTKAVPIKKVSRDVGTYVHWSASSDALHWLVGPNYHSRDLKDSFAFIDGAPEELPGLDEPGIEIGLNLKTDTPQGLIALKGARIITMNGDEVIENGTILIENNRIKAVGSSNSVKIPRKAKTIDVTGKTIMPGIVDVHAHANHFFSGIIPQTFWPYYVNMAYGVTTTHDPSANTETVFSLSELVKSGDLVGPRVYSTGTILYGADGDFKAVVNSLDDARSHLRRMKAVGAFSVKSYNQPRRDQRQQILQAAHELEMMVVNEGGSTFFHNLTMIIDGTTGVEHNLPVAPLYKDVVDLWAATEVGYTPTLVVNFGGASGEYYWYQNTDVWSKKRLLDFHPRGQVDARSRRREKLPDNEWYYQTVAAGCKAVTDKGVRVQIGAHGQLQGLAAHWETWMLVQGGMTNMEALQSATINGAWYIGLDDDIGSLEKGKLADLIVLEKNPLQDIYNTESVTHVMVNGRLYDAATMHEMGARSKNRDLFYWERDGETGGQFGAYDGKIKGCSCGRQ